MHRFADYCESIEGAHRREDPAQRAPGRIGPLSPAHRELLPLPAPTEQGIEQQRFCAPLNQARAELA